MSPTGGFQIRGWHVLAMVVTFFLVVFAVDGAFAVYAYRTFPGQVSVTPYEDGVTYNRHLAQLAAQEKLGWTPMAGVTPQGNLKVEVRDREGALLKGLNVTGRLERPATEAGRVVPVFHEESPGVYVAKTAGLTGSWDLTAELKDREGHAFEAERRLTWP
jgi:nitrogen fixation protein FixH